MALTNVRHPDDIKYDRILAAMETGNFGLARQILKEIEETDSDFAYRIRSEVSRDYGVVL